MILSVLKSTSWLISAQILTKIIAFFYILFLANKLGVEDFGLYSLALSYFLLISSLSELGISRYFVREVSKDKSKISTYLSNIILLRLAIILLTFGTFSLFNYLLDPNKLRVSIVLIAVSAAIPQAVAFSVDAVFVALQKLSYSAISLLVLNITTAAIGFYLVKEGFGLFAATTAVLIGQILYAAMLIIFALRQKIIFSPFFNEESIKKIAIGSLPYGFLAILGLLYFRIDTVLLAYLKGSYDTGIYSAAYKFLEAIIFIPASLAIALFPVFSKLHGEDTQKIKELSIKVIKIMGGLGILAVVFYNLALPLAISVLLPAYTSSIKAVGILSLAIPFIFIHIPLSQVLLSTDKYLKDILLISFATVLFNIGLNVVFIPQFGYIASAWITVASDVLSLALILLVLKKHIFKY